MRRSNSSMTSTGHGAPPLLNVRTCSRPYSLDLRVVRAATRRWSARRGSRSAGSRGSRRAPARRRTSGWMICSAPIQMPHHHADRERVDVEVRDHEQVARRRRARTPDSSTSRSGRRSRRCSRGSASRPSACRWCRRCTAGRRDRPASIGDARQIWLAAGCVEQIRRATASPSTRGGGAAAAEYSASDVTMTCSMAVWPRTPCDERRQRVERDAATRMPESAATVSTSRAV